MSSIQGREVINYDEKGHIIKSQITNIMEVAKVKNTLTSDAFFATTSKWNKFDMDWWTIIEAQVREKKDNTVIKIPVDKVKELMNINTKEGIQKFINRSNKTLLKIQSMVVSHPIEENGKTGFRNVNIFSESSISPDLKVVLKVNPEAIEDFTAITHYTKFAIEQSIYLHSIHTKKIFLMLKQWRTKGSVNLDFDDLKRNLNVKYKPGQMDQKIISPAIEDLAPFFQNLKITKYYDAKSLRPGRPPLEGYKVTFKSEPLNSRDAGFNSAVKTTNAISSIMTNPNLANSTKYRSVDRYRGLKIGSTEKFVNKVHPLTIFLDASDVFGRDNENNTHRKDLARLNYFEIDNLKYLASKYEELLKSSALKEWDITDLCEIELALFKKLKNKNYSKSMQEAFVKIPGKTIAETMIHDDPNPLGTIKNSIIRINKIYLAAIK